VISLHPGVQSFVRKARSVARPKNQIIRPRRRFSFTPLHEDEGKYRVKVSALSIASPEEVAT
jgi:hypothetical protein